ncbi:hypothetical protein Sjap_002884 [Stephania japonica]|uniref:Uncharacterized protein n=1 Tax=Stephania japonica TaxID=461633 RepID=A0AAP0KPF3_9MAGN
MATTLNLGGVKSMDSKGRDEVHVAAMPLRATKGPAQLLFSSAYSLNLWDLQHYMVIVRPYSPSQHQAFVFDFQPEDPENIYTALAALSGRGIPGTVLERKIACLPKSKCWFVGYSDTDAIERAKRLGRVPNWPKTCVGTFEKLKHYLGGNWHFSHVEVQYFSSYIENKILLCSTMRIRGDPAFSSPLLFAVTIQHPDVDMVPLDDLVGFPSERAPHGHVDLR